MSDPPDVPDDDTSGHLMRGFDRAPVLPGAATGGPAGDPGEVDPAADLAVDARPAGLAEFTAGDRWLFSVTGPGAAPAAPPWWAELPGAPLDQPPELAPDGPPDGPRGGTRVRLADLDRSAQGAGPPVPLDEPDA